MEEVSEGGERGGKKEKETRLKNRRKLERNMEELIRNGEEERKRKRQEK